MKKVILMSVMLFWAGLCSFARNTSLETFAAVMESYRVELDLDFEISRGVENIAGGNAVLLYQDGDFRLTSGDNAVYNNAEACLSVMGATKEIVVDKPLSIDLSEDPKNILDLLGVNSKGADMRYGLSQDGMLKSVQASLGDGTRIMLRIRSVKKTPKSSDLSDFSFNMSALDKGWSIADLR